MKRPVIFVAAVLGIIATICLVFYIGFIWIFVDNRRRGWMDLLAGTVVIAAPPPPYSR